MNEQTSEEGNPSIEAVERQALGTTSYQKVEVVHRFANASPWFHPLLVVAAVVAVACVFLLLKRITAKKPNE